MLEKLLMASGSALASALIAVAGMSAFNQLVAAAHHWAGHIEAAAAWSN